MFHKIKVSYEIERDYQFQNLPTLAKIALQSGGKIVPLILPYEYSKGTGVMNPSILKDDSGKLRVIIRHTNYILFHSERKKHPHAWGNLVYLHHEDDMKLRTDNYYGELDKDYNLQWCTKIDTSDFDVEPLWSFVGLEDARLVFWDGKYFITGVRRDTTTNGQGRMELSELDIKDQVVKEVSRVRIKAPGTDASYCEKNWMPVLDQPFTYIKWCNPTEVVLADIETGNSKTTHLTSNQLLFGIDPRGLTEPRGSSQIIPYKDGYLAVVHEADLFDCELRRKDGVYRHRFIYWDKQWNIISYSKDFSFLNGHIEFTCGMCMHNDSLLITFAVSDNLSYVLEIPSETVFNMLERVF